MNLPQPLVCLRALLITLTLLSLRSLAVQAQVKPCNEIMYVDMSARYSFNCAALVDDQVIIKIPKEQTLSDFSLKFADATGRLQDVPTNGFEKVPSDGSLPHQLILKNARLYLTTLKDDTKPKIAILIKGKTDKEILYAASVSTGGTGGTGGTDKKLASASTYDEYATSQYPRLRNFRRTNGRMHYERRLNQWLDHNTIHVFVDENGDFIRSSLPTTATEKNFFVVHVIYRLDNANPGKASTIRCTFEGDYDPKFEVYGTKSDAASANGAVGETPPQFSEKVFGPFGPFTEQVVVKTTVGDKTIIDKTVKIAKLHHIALNAGLFGTFLRNPDNIRVGTLPNGDTTLLADDPTTRGFVTVMLTFYPHPRNLLFPLSKDWRERIGFTVGTSISKKLAENFFGGISYDVARGMALVGGVHYGRRQVVVDNEYFDFGKDRFTGGAIDNRVIKKWGEHFFIGINIDSRLLTYIFNTPSAANP